MRAECLTLSLSLGVTPANIAINDISLKTRFFWPTFPLQYVLVYLQPLLRNPPRKLPNSVKLRSGYGYYAVRGHPRSPSLVSIRKPICDFLLVINTNLASVLHRFRDIAFDRSKIAMLPLLCLTPPTEGFPWDDLRKIFIQRLYGWPRYNMA